MDDVRRALDAQIKDLQGKIARLENVRADIESKAKEAIESRVARPLAELTAEEFRLQNALLVLEGKPMMTRASGGRVSRQSDEQRTIASKIISLTQSLRQLRHEAASGRGANKSAIADKIRSIEAELVPLRARKNELKNQQRREARKR